ncbi:hypothetical protein NBRC116601_31470 [Cognatishimia sp. WU-CL00825]|uniref:DUF1330 domain-containing protein n=1 Tax=Cognatishimia sp. WU-CL00825 TaxID=3127658 RepID=UPI00310C8378
MTSKIYTIAFYDEVHDETALQAYAELAAPAVLAAGARYLSRGEPVATYEAGQQARVTLLEWDSLEQALALYESPAYLEALEKLGGSVRRDIRIVPAFDRALLAADADDNGQVTDHTDGDS